MTSLALLAHATTTPKFNSALYATLATIIPVLFIGLAVQGSPARDSEIQRSVYQDLTGAAISAARRARDKKPDGIPIAAISLLVVAFLIVVYAGAGEIRAIIALIQQDADTAARNFTASAAIILSLAVAARPAAGFVRMSIQVLAGELEPESGRAEGAAADDGAAWPAAAEPSAVQEQDSGAELPAQDAGTTPGEPAPSGTGERDLG